MYICINTEPEMGGRATAARLRAHKRTPYTTRPGEERGDGAPHRKGGGG